MLRTPDRPNGWGDILRQLTALTRSVKALAQWRNTFKITGGRGITVKRHNGAWIVSNSLEASTVAGSSSSFFYGRIGASPVKDGNRCRWKYAWVEVEKTSTGWGGWTTKTNGRSGTTTTGAAYNTIEDMAPAGTGTPANGRGLQGNGVNTTTVVGTFAIQPAPVGLVVLMRMVPIVGTSNFEPTFSYENAYDGSCT